ncbi:thermonuclease family protein [Thermodesulfobacteriota bacterium]
MQKLIIVISCIVIFWFSSVSAHTWTGKVVEVRGGDVLDIAHPEEGVLTIMLYGINAPEERQHYFKQAKEFLKEQVEGRVVNVQELLTEQKILTAVVVHDGVNINEKVLQAGYGWVYEKYCDQCFCSDWLIYEKQARDKKLGLWQDENPTPPWEWREKVLTKIFRIFMWAIPPRRD